MGNQKIEKLFLISYPNKARRKNWSNKEKVRGGLSFLKKETKTNNHIQQMKEWIITNHQINLYATTFEAYFSRK